MKIIYVRIDKIRPDPKQPRTTIEEADLKEMAQSIVTEGVINPIEVDKKLVIITGERRWRAAKIAGLKTVPVKILELENDARFMRQVVENVHHDTMTDWDIANALKKLLSLRPGSKHLKAPLTGPTGDQGQSWLAKKIGKSTDYIREKLSILEASKQMQAAIKSGQITGTYVRAVNRTPEEYKKDIEKKILAGEFKTAHGALNFAAALTRTKNPHLAKEIIERDYSEFETEKEVDNFVSKISPPAHELIGKTYEPSKDISKIADDLRDWIQSNPKDGVGANHAARVIINTNFIREAVDSWMKGDSKKLLEFVEDKKGVKEQADAVRQLAEIFIEIMEMLDKHPLANLDNFHGPIMVNDLKNFEIFVQNWLKGDAKVLENKLPKGIRLLGK